MPTTEIPTLVLPTLVLPNSWVLLGILVGALLFLAYLTRTPRDYPLRGKLMAVAGLTVAAVALALASRAAGPAMALAANADRARARYLESRPADSLAAYVPIPPTVAGLRAAHGAGPELGGNRPTTRWTARPARSGLEVMRFYHDPRNQDGWRVELSADSMLVLARERRALGQRGMERMRIQLRDPAAVEYELTRRY
jgi:hypothetical protein